ncbi:MAG: hypothetical protein V4490_00050 [Pseudomonadota bacterium]
MGSWAHVTECLLQLPWLTAFHVKKLKNAWCKVYEQYSKLPKDTNYSDFIAFRTARERLFAYEETAQPLLKSTATHHIPLKQPSGNPTETGNKKRLIHVNQSNAPSENTQEGLNFDAALTPDELLLIKKIIQLSQQYPKISITLKGDIDFIHEAISFCQMHRSWVVYMRDRTKYERILKTRFEDTAYALQGAICDASILETEFRKIYRETKTSEIQSEAEIVAKPWWQQLWAALVSFGQWVADMFKRGARWVKSCVLPKKDTGKESNMDSEQAAPPPGICGIPIPVPKRPPMSIFSHTALDDADKPTTIPISPNALPKQSSFAI